MDIRVHKAPFEQWRADAYLFFALIDSGDDLPGFAKFRREARYWPAESRSLADFKAKSQKVGVFYAPDGAPVQGVPSQVYLAGLGAREKLDLETLRLSSATAGTEASSKVEVLGLPLWALEGLPFDESRALEEVLVALALGLYKFNGLKSAAEDGNDNDCILRELVVLTESDPDEQTLDAVRRAEAAIQGIYLARDLVNTPANIATPEYLAGKAGEIARNWGYRLEVLERDTIIERGMGCLAAVMSGSREPAKLIVLESSPGEDASEEPPILFVGKGITFDTGGISLKPSARMEDMKSDMGGAAAVLGFFEAMGRLGLKRRVIGVMPCTENMPGGQAVKPGDVVKSLSGKSVEIINTDAEGRLVLCDAMTYGQERDPWLVVDIATLTGACVVALGYDVSGVFSNCPGLSELVRDVGLEAGERYWPMPIYDFYDEALKSQVADMKNVGAREGGAIHAAKFLQRFVDKGRTWIHLDIAGPAYRGKKNALCGEGGSGIGVRVLLELAQRSEEIQSLCDMEK